MEENKRLTVCVLGEEHRDDLCLRGTKSGRDTDKVAEIGLTPMEVNGVYGLREAETVVVLHRLYTDVLKKRRISGFRF